MTTTTTQISKACKGMGTKKGGMNIENIEAYMGYPKNTKKTSKELRNELKLWCMMDNLLPHGFASDFDIVLAFRSAGALVEQTSDHLFIDSNSTSFITRDGTKSHDMKITGFKQARHQRVLTILPLTLEFDGVKIRTDNTNGDPLFEEEYIYSHQNVCIQDGTTMYRYEPMFRPGDKAMLTTHETIKVTLENLGYEYVFDVSSPGVQDRYPGENCVLYCAFFIHTFLEHYTQTKVTKIAYERALEQIQTWCISGQYPGLFLTFTRNILQCTTSRLATTKIEI